MTFWDVRNSQKSNFSPMKKAKKLVKKTEETSINADLNATESFDYRGLMEPNLNLDEAVKSGKTDLFFDCP